MPIFAFSPGVHHAEFSANIRQYMTGTHVEVEALVTLMESSLRMEFNMAMLLPVHSKCLFKKIQFENIFRDGSCESVAALWSCILPSSLEWLMTIFHIIVSLTHIDGEDPHTLSVKHCQWYFSHFKYIGDIGASAWLCRHANIKWCSVSCSKLLTAAKTNNFQDFQVTRAKEMQANEHRQIIYNSKCCLVDNYQNQNQSFIDH